MNLIEIVSVFERMIIVLIFGYLFFASNNGFCKDLSLKKKLRIDLFYLRAFALCGAILFFLFTFIHGFELSKTDLFPINILRISYVTMIMTLLYLVWKRPIKYNDVPIMFFIFCFIFLLAVVPIVTSFLPGYVNHENLMFLVISLFAMMFIGVVLVDYFKRGKNGIFAAVICFLVSNLIYGVLMFINPEGATNSIALLAYILGLSFFAKKFLR